jgi:hypothetical protein
LRPVRAGAPSGLQAGAGALRGAGSTAAPPPARVEAGPVPGAGFERTDEAGPEGRAGLEAER